MNSIGRITVASNAEDVPDASEHAALVEVVMKAHGDVLVKAMSL